jgi:hypothetical protein
VGLPFVLSLEATVTAPVRSAFLARDDRIQKCVKHFWNSRSTKFKRSPPVTKVPVKYSARMKSTTVASWFVSSANVRWGLFPLDWPLQRVFHPCWAWILNTVPTWLAVNVIPHSFWTKLWKKTIYLFRDSNAIQCSHRSITQISCVETPAWYREGSITSLSSAEALGGIGNLRCGRWNEFNGP